MLQYRLSHIGVCMLAVGIFVGGAANNWLSGACIAMALICWVATGQSKGLSLVGAAAVIGWLFLAALISAAYRIK